MGIERQFVNKLHSSTKRDYLARMNDDKVACMEKAREYGFDYWDGSRRFGYGGYKYLPGRWKPVAEEMIRAYGLKSGSRVLDVGCGKGFLLYEMQLLEPGLEITGIDVSPYALENRHPELKGTFFQHNAQAALPFNHQEFDLAISLATLHNLRLFELKTAVGEIARVSRQGYIMIESYRNARELFNLECWALSAHTFLDNEEWPWLFREFGYPGDYEFIYFE